MAFTHIRTQTNKQPKTQRIRKKTAETKTKRRLRRFSDDEGKITRVAYYKRCEWLRKCSQTCSKVRVNDQRFCRGVGYGLVGFYIFRVRIGPKHCLRVPFHIPFSKTTVLCSSGIPHCEQNTFPGCYELWANPWHGTHISCCQQLRSILITKSVGVVGNISLFCLLTLNNVYLYLCKTELLFCSLSLLFMCS